MEFPKYLTTEQAAELVPFDAAWIRKRLRTGEIKGFNPSGSWLTTAEAVHAYIASGTNDTTAGATKRRKRRKRQMTR